MQIRGLSNGELLRVTSAVFSLSSTSCQEILESKKGVYLTSRSTEALGFATMELVLETNIFEHDI